MSLRKIAVLGAAANGNAVLELVVELVDGTRSRPMKVPTYDWWGGSQPPASAVAASGMSRSKNSGVLDRESLAPGFNLYEAMVDLETEGLSHTAVRSLHFKLGAIGVSVGVFAISGQPTQLEEIRLNLQWGQNDLLLDMFIPTGRIGSLEHSLDLLSWREVFKATGQGSVSPVRVTFPWNPDAAVGFWRVQVP